MRDKIELSNIGKINGNYIIGHFDAFFNGICISGLRLLRGTNGKLFIPSMAIINNKGALVYEVKMDKEFKALLLKKAKTAFNVKDLTAMQLIRREEARNEDNA